MVSPWARLPLRGVAAGVVWAGATAALGAASTAGATGNGPVIRVEPAAAERSSGDGAQHAFRRFAQGADLAAQARWPQARQAFFEAHRLAPAHPGYALNLAISLDRLGRSEQALHYYHLALDLADRNGADFDAAPVARRIGALLRQLQP